LESGFRLGPLRIHPKAGEATGPAGTEKLDPKVMGVLVALAEHAGEVVSREALLARVWPGVVVTDEALSRCIYELRRQLGAAGGAEVGRTLIETLPKRGYRLNAEVLALQPPAPSPPAAPQAVAPAGRRRAVVVAAGALFVLAAIAVYAYLRQPDVPALPADRSVAVLPFVDLSERKDQGYFGDGIAEEILNQLAQSNELRVIARTSSFALRDETLGIPAIAQKLSVSHVLEGSVRMSGDRIRVTAQLVQGTDGAHLWSETFERNVSDVFAIQDEIASAVATALRITLAGAAPGASPPANVAAYENYLQGEFFYNRRSPGDVERSIGYFKQAIASDPRYARAWAALSAAYAYLAWGGTEVDREMQRLQEEAALHAVELDPRLAVAQVRLSGFYEETGQIDKAEEHFRIARSLDPDEPLVLSHMISAALESGQVADAIDMQRRVVNRDPLNRTARQNLGVFLFYAGRLEEALDEFRAALELAPDAGPDLEIEFGRIHAQQGRDAEAHAEFMRLPPGRFRDQGLALLHRLPEHRAESDAALARLTADPAAGSESMEQDVMSYVRLAEAQAFRGMTDAALATLADKRRALAGKWGDSSNVVWYFQHEAHISPFLKGLADDPRWAAVMAGHH